MFIYVINAPLDIVVCIIQPTVSKLNARSDLEMLGIKDSTQMIQTAALLGSANILRKTLSL